MLMCFNQSAGHVWDPKCCKVGMATECATSIRRGTQNNTTYRYLLYLGFEATTLRITEFEWDLTIRGQNRSVFYTSRSGR